MATTTPSEGISYRRIFSGRYGYLLTSLVLLNILAPILIGRGIKAVLIDLLLCTVMLSGIYAASPRRRSLTIGLLLVIAILATHQIVDRAPVRALFALHYTLEMSILAFATLTILSAIIRDDRVTLETVKGAVCIYLLLGMIWAFLFSMIDLAIPGSFRLPLGPESRRVGSLLLRDELPSLLYFSYATLTTLGYGDILPVSAPARTACYLEAIVGQIYLTVLIARLVGMHISQPLRVD
jgi:hypothetical protein